MPTEVTDPDVLSQLNADAGPKEVTDPAILEQLNKPPKTGRLGAFTDIGHETYEAGKAALSAINENLNPWSEGAQAKIQRQLDATRKGFLPGLAESAKGTFGAAEGVLGVPEAVMSPITGTARSVIGHGLTDFDTALKSTLSPAQQAIRPPITYEDAKKQADLAMMGLGTSRGLGARSAGLPRVPPPPTEAVTLSEGQRTGDLAAIQREQAAARNPAVPGHQRAQEFGSQQAQELDRLREGIRRGLDPTGQGIVHADTPGAMGEAVSQGMQREAGRARAGVDAAYEAARGYPGEINAGVFEGIGQKIKGDLTLGDSPVIIDDKLTPHANAMIRDIDQRVSNLRIQNSADPFGQPDPSRITGVNLNGVDQMRKRLSTMRGDAFASGNRADGRAARAVLDAFDNHIDQAVNGGHFNGDPRAIQAWNDARGQYSAFRQTFTAGRKDPVGSAVEKIIGWDRPEPASTADVVNSLIGASGTKASTTSLGVVNRVRDVLGAGSPEWGAVKQGLFSRIMEPAEGVTEWGHARAANKISEFLRGSGRQLAETVFSLPERQLLREYADLRRTLEVPQAGANWSNTSVFVRGMDTVANGITRVVGAIIGGGIGHGVPSYLGEAMGAAAANVVASPFRALSNLGQAKRIRQQMPLIAERVRNWQRAYDRAQRLNNAPSRIAATTAATNLSRALSRIGVSANLARADEEQKQGEGDQKKNGGVVGGKQGPAHGGRLYAEGGDVDPALPDIGEYEIAPSGRPRITVTPAPGPTPDPQGSVPGGSGQFSDAELGVGALPLPGASPGLASTAGPTVTSTVPAEDIPPPVTNREGETFPTFAIKQYLRNKAELGEKAIGAAGELQRTGEYEDPSGPMGVAGQTMGMGTFGTLLPEARGSLGIFGGKAAKTANKEMLAKAEEMEASGAPRTSIWNQTGWFRGYDKQWRFEIPDQGASTGLPNPKTGTVGSFGGPASENLTHPELYAAYPHLAEVPTMIELGRPGGETQLNPPGASSAIRSMSASGHTEAERTGIMLHEMQHGVQAAEGFAPGSSPGAGVTPKKLEAISKSAAEYQGLKWDEITPDLRNKIRQTVGFELYRTHAGEVEARNVQTRQDFEHRQIPPWETEDVPPNVRQIIPGAKGKIPFRQKYEPGEQPPIANPGEHALSVNDILHADTPARPEGSNNVWDVAKELHARGSQALRDLGVESGSVRADTTTPEIDAMLARTMAHETEAAMEREGHAGDWYRGAVERAMKIGSIVYPEIATDPGKAFAFRVAHAITSQNEKVPSNVRLTDQAYSYFKENGRFPTNIEANKGAAINGNFEKINGLLEKYEAEGMSPVEALGETHKFMHRTFTARELGEAGYNMSAFNKDDMVYGSAILGPKIGQGFYQNLSGNFNPVTTDLWYTRTWGRLTGTLSGFPEAVPKALERFKNAMKEEGRAMPRTRADATFEDLRGNAGLNKLVDGIVSTHERDYVKNSKLYKSKEKTKSELTKAAERLQLNLHGVKEQPASAGERTWMSRVTNMARQNLEDRGHKISNADLQALIWYPEKDLYAKMGSRQDTDRNVDYATAWRNMAKKKGYSDEAIDKTLGGVGRALGGRVRPVERGRWVGGPAHDQRAGQGGVPRDRQKNDRAARSAGQDKQLKPEVHYTAYSRKTDRCGLCTMFRAPNGCTAVQGVISPRGWCELFEARAGEGRAMGGRVDPPKIVRTFDVPYLAGASNNGKTVYIDRRVPSRIRVKNSSGKGFRYIDPALPLSIHEITEWTAMTQRKVPYEQAHTKLATPAEHKWLTSHGLDWKNYEEVMDGYLDHIEHEHPKRPPPDLYLKPYPHNEEKILARLEKKEAA